MCEYSTQKNIISPMDQILWNSFPEFSLSGVEKCLNFHFTFTLWNYDICVWHPPTFDICHNFLCKRNYVLKQVPTHLLVRCHKIRSFFFLKASLTQLFLLHTKYFNGALLKCFIVIWNSIFASLTRNNIHPNEGPFLRMSVR